jgi:hypothetical protein
MENHQQLTQFWSDLRAACNENDLEKLLELVQPSVYDIYEETEQMESEVK